MPNLIRIFLFAIVSILATVCLALSQGMETRESYLDTLFEQLRTSEGREAFEIERQIVRIWSDSGSPSMNLLLQRGRRAIGQGRYRMAIRHLTMLTQLAPEFAEGWNSRATAYYLLGEYELSLADIARTLSLNERHFGAISGMAMIFESQGDDRGALRALEMVEEIYPYRHGLEDSIFRLRQELLDNSI